MQLEQLLLLLLPGLEQSQLLTVQELFVAEAGRRPCTLPEVPLV